MPITVGYEPVDWLLEQANTVGARTALERERRFQAMLDDQKFNQWLQTQQLGQQQDRFDRGYAQDERRLGEQARQFDLGYGLDVNRQGQAAFENAQSRSQQQYQFDREQDQRANQFEKQYGLEAANFGLRADEQQFTQDRYSDQTQLDAQQLEDQKDRYRREIEAKYNGRFGFTPDQQQRIDEIKKQKLIIQNDTSLYPEERQQAIDQLDQQLAQYQEQFIPNEEANPQDVFQQRRIVDNETGQVFIAKKDQNGDWDFKTVKQEKGEKPDKRKEFTDSQMNSLWDRAKKDLKSKILAAENQKRLNDGDDDTKPLRMDDIQDPPDDLILRRARDLMDKQRQLTGQPVEDSAQAHNDKAIAAQESAAQPTEQPADLSPDEQLLSDKLTDEEHARLSEIGRLIEQATAVGATDIVNQLRAEAYSIIEQAKQRPSPHPADYDPQGYKIDLATGESGT